MLAPASAAAANVGPLIFIRTGIACFFSTKAKISMTAVPDTRPRRKMIVIRLAPIDSMNMPESDQSKAESAT